MYKQAIWDVTSKCNLRCRHCYAAAKYDNAKALSSDLTLADAKKVLENLKAMGFVNILLLGGEPLYRKDIFDILEYASLLDLNIMINTNGTFLNKEYSLRLLNFNVSQISFSLEGTSSKIHECIAGNGTFKKTLLGIETFMNECKKANKNVLTGIQYTLTKPNLCDTSNFLDFALSVGVNGFSVNFLDNNGRVRDNKDLMITPEEYIDALEVIFDSVAKSDKITDPDFLIQVSGRQMIIEYLSEKYNFNISTSPTGYLCPAGTNVVLVENDGTITPCGVANNRLFYNSKYIIENLNILQLSSTDSLYETKFFDSFIEFKKKRNSVCGNCLYAESCQICPILYETEIVLCQVAQKRYKQWREIEENKKLNLIINPELYLLVESNFSKQILKYFTQDMTLSEIAELISNETLEPLESVRNDLWEFYRCINKFKW